MAAEKVPADNAETLNRLEELRREAQQVSDRSQPTPGLMFVLPPNNHPHPGQILDRRVIPVFGGGSGWLDPGQWCAALNLRMPPSDDVARYQVFFDFTGVMEITKLKAIANEVAKLLGRIGYDVIPEQLYFELFERCEESGRLRWGLNEQPDHPETQSAVARLDDVFGEIAAWLREFCDKLGGRIKTAAISVNPGKGKRGRPKGAVASDVDGDRNIYEAWTQQGKATFGGITTFANSLNIDEELVRAAMERHRKRLPTSEIMSGDTQT